MLEKQLRRSLNLLDLCHYERRDEANAQHSTHFASSSEERETLEKSAGFLQKQELPPMPCYTQLQLCLSNRMTAKPS